MRIPQIMNGQAPGVMPGAYDALSARRDRGRRLEAWSPVAMRHRQHAGAGRHGPIQHARLCDHYVASAPRSRSRLCRRDTGSAAASQCVVRWCGPSGAGVAGIFISDQVFSQPLRAIYRASS